MIKDWILNLAYASQFMQNMGVDSLIENIRTKIFIRFHLTNFMTYLARLANSMVVFSASYIPSPLMFKNVKIREKYLKNNSMTDGDQRTDQPTCPTMQQCVRAVTLCVLIM